MTDKELDEISDRCERASLGPWKAWLEGRDHASGSNIVQTGREDIEMSGALPEDYDFIAHARQDIPHLVAEVRRLRELLGANK